MVTVLWSVMSAFCRQRGGLYNIFETKEELKLKMQEASERGGGVIAGFYGIIEKSKQA